ncbi:hypothetical protein ACWDBD_02320 [Streptomyces sp. NPDC001118]
MIGVLVGAVKRFTAPAGRLAAGKGLFDRLQPLAGEAGLELPAEAELERGYAFEAVLLMADAGTISAARSLQRHAWVLEHFVRDMRTGTRDDWMRAFREFQEKRDAFYIAARHSLGVHAEFRLRSEDPAILGPDPRDR